MCVCVCVYIYIHIHYIYTHTYKHYIYIYIYIYTAYDRLAYIRKFKKSEHVIRQPTIEILLEYS